MVSNIFAKYEPTWPVGSANDENVLLRAHTIHFSKNLVDHTISRTASIADVPSTSLGN